MTNVDILGLPMGGNDAGAATIRDYLKALLLTLLAEGEGFSGKRPFGNSGWEYELYLPLIKAGLVAGKLDENECIEDCDSAKAELIIRDAVNSL